MRRRAVAAPILRQGVVAGAVALALAPRVGGAAGCRASIWPAHVNAVAFAT
jgi:hypothetical protein